MATHCSGDGREAGRRADTDRAPVSPGRLPGRDDEAEVLLQAGPPQDRLDLVAQRARGDPERQRGREPLDAGGCLGIEHLGRGHDLVEDRRLAGDDPRDFLPVPAEAATIAERPERRGVVEAQYSW